MCERTRNVNIVECGLNQNVTGRGLGSMGVHTIEAYLSSHGDVPENERPIYHVGIGFLGQCPAVDTPENPLHTISFISTKSITELMQGSKLSGEFTHKEVEWFVMNYPDLSFTCEFAGTDHCPRGCTKHEN